MQTESIASRKTNRPHACEDVLSDFSTDPRVVILSIMALVIGAISSVVAWVLLWLINLITNIAFFHRSAPCQ